ncbi:MAG: pyridoxal phosphate-dependent aminotransferase [Leuconostoc mesenteroides]|uniref:pyridoxal phosphate-dependent aminotransferase n=1 Tax=Leuconostoc mesenteroides TaxID=1245 RepID=UPI000FFCD23C|nr:pyridoxal phosphate-dependent aminotransferase [Leuconostoc mesenteroides]QAR69451.1 pyridoxal phosphate-dependent aminotransferase [Leuconostoc mesenteroides]WJM73818.1 pyridoxal phosphate-dependent aminotransferase [Leuconostoc mesenteroides]
MKTFSNRVNAITASPTLAMNGLAKQMQEEGIDVINLGVGEPDFQTPKNISDAAIEAIQAQKTSFYTPASGLPALKQAIVENVSKRYEAAITTQNVSVTTGAKLSLYVLMQVLLNPGDTVVTAAPEWVSYVEQIKLAGGELIEVHSESSSMKLTVSDLDKIKETVKLVIVNSPTNPTGQVYSKQEIQDILDWSNTHGVYVILDEIYGQLVYNGAEFTSGLQLQHLENSAMIIVDGVSKAYSMTGWRIGWTLASSEIISAMNKLLGHMTSNPTVAAQYAAIEALNGEQDTVENMRQAFEQRLNTTFEAINKINGVHVDVKPQGAFYLFPQVDEKLMKLVGVSNTVELSTKILEEAHVALPAGEGFGMPGYLRLSYAKDQDTLNEAVLRLTQFFKKYTKD